MIVLRCPGDLVQEGGGVHLRGRHRGRDGLPRNHPGQMKIKYIFESISIQLKKVRKFPIEIFWNIGARNLEI